MNNLDALLAMIANWSVHSIYTDTIYYAITFIDTLTMLETMKLIR